MALRAPSMRHYGCHAMFAIISRYAATLILRRFIDYAAAISLRSMPLAIAD